MDSHHLRHDPFPVTFDLDHVLLQDNPSLQTTVDPANLILAQPFHGPSQFYDILHGVASTEHNFVGYPAVEPPSQEAPVLSSQSMDHTPGQYSVINRVPARDFTGPSTPVGRMYRGLSTCQWELYDGSICGKAICGKTVPEHLAEHGIQSMHREHKVLCYWLGCGVFIKRQSITRHCREVHLGLKRKSHKHAIPSGGRCY